MAEWEAFDKVNPIGGDRLDFHFAHLISHLTNLIGKSLSKDFQTVELKDFIPNWSGIEDEPEVMSAEQMKEFWINFAKEHNKTVKKKPEK